MSRKISRDSRLKSQYQDEKANIKTKRPISRQKCQYPDKNANIKTKRPILRQKSWQMKTKTEMNGKALTCLRQEELLSFIKRNFKELMGIICDRNLLQKSMEF